MVKQLYNLTVNEIIKKYKKKSLIIITVIIFLVGIGYPLLFKKMTKNISDMYQLSYGFNIGQLQQQLKDANSKTDVGKVQESFLKSQINVEKLLESVNAEPAGWQSYEGNKYLTGLIEIDSLNLLKENINPNIILGELPKGVSAEEVQKTLMTDQANTDTAISKIKTENSKIENRIKDNDYLGYLKEDIGNKHKEVDNLKKVQKNLNDEKAKQGDIASINTQIKGTEKAIDNLNSNIKLEQYRYDNHISYSLNNWKNLSLMNIQMNNQIVNEKIMTKGEYLSNVSNGVSYEKYTEVFNKNKEKAENAIKTSWYGLEHNIPPISSATGARESVNLGVVLFTIIIAILGAVLAGGMVSKEFSTGTIRLLLIRPMKRWKILLSKLISLLIISYVVLIISMIISTITSGIAFGFGDLANPVLKVVNGAVVEQSYFVNLCGHLFFNSITIIFTICVAFFISTVVKSSAAAVAVSIILFIGSFPATLIMMHEKWYWIVNSPIPYINLPAVPAIQGIESQVLFNSTLGGVELIIISAILVIISLVVFCKKDITN